jgi:primosomal protein N''
MKKVLLIVIPVLLLVAGFLLKGARKESSPARAEIVSQPAAPEAEEQLQSLGYVMDTKSTFTRKVIQSGEVTIQVKQYERFFKALQKRVGMIHGYVSNVQSQRSGDAVSSASLTLRIPPEQLHAVVSWLREQGMLITERIQTEDISEQYYDLKARLENAHRFETRLLEMLKSETGKLQDLILVEEKINQIREQIEQMEGKLRYFDALSTLANLSIQIQVESTYVSPQAPTFVQRAVRSAKESWKALGSATQEVAILLIMVLPWLIPATGMFYVLRFVVRHVGKGRKVVEAVV